MNEILTGKKLYKSYDSGLIESLSGIDIHLKAGNIYALMGPSGCGKSTLLNILGTLDYPTSGEVFYNGKKIEAFEKEHLFRQKFLGFVFQFHHLIPVLTIKENIELALLPDIQLTEKKRSKRIHEIMEEMHISHRADAYSNKISGGERQRGAIARALVNNPKLILADEPTGNVDSQTARAILKSMRTHINKTDGTILIATHDHSVADMADVIFQMKDGKIINQ
jgi:putative ABC transport system ATP-binding protein